MVSLDSTCGDSGDPWTDRSRFKKGCQIKRLPKGLNCTRTGALWIDGHSTETFSFANCFERDESVNGLGSVISVSCLDIYLGKDTVTLMVSQAKYDLLNHAVNLLRWLLSSSNVQWPSQHYTTTYFCCFFTKSTMPSIFNLFFFFLFLGLSKDIGTQCTLCVSCSRGGNVKTDQMEYLDPTLLIGAPMQPVARFWSFKLEEQRAGTTFTICIETMKCYCIVLSVRRR